MFFTSAHQHMQHVYFQRRANCSKFNLVLTMICFHLAYGHMPYHCSHCFFFPFKHYSNSYCLLFCVSIANTVFLIFHVGTTYPEKGEHPLALTYENKIRLKTFSRHELCPENWVRTFFVCFCQSHMKNASGDRHVYNGRTIPRTFRRAAAPG